jgi:phosphoesterase RecJ-like protein
LPRDVATPLFLGLATDTGWFRFSNVRQQTLALAARLIGAGVDHASLYEMIEQQNTAARMRLLARALSSLELHKHASIALMSLTQADFKEAGADSEDTGGFADGPMSVVGVQVVVTLTEMTKPGDPNPLTKASLRSKPGPHAIDVAAVCNKLGGGGHARAAGVKLKLPLASAREVVLKALQA